MSISFKHSICLYSLVLVTLFSCKKEIDTPVTPTPEPEVRTKMQLLKDSVYYYYKLYSLWETSIPKYDVISSFTDAISTPQGVLDNLKAKTPSYPGYALYGGVYDRFSYFSQLDGYSSLSAALRMDTNTGYGLYFTWGAIGDVAYPFISNVEGGSPAFSVLHRSDMVLALNGNEDLKVNITCDAQNGCAATDADKQKFQNITNLLQNSLSQSTMSIKVQKADNTVKSADLVFKTYEIDPLFSDAIFEFSNMNVGYFGYSSFEEIEDNNLNQRKVDELFTKFAGKNIKALIVDLRYNGGGYVDAATYMADKIINSAGKGKLMMTYELNSYLTRQKNLQGSSFKDVYFTKNNNLELETVCFIVTENTASAAEMLINVLRPYMNVKIIAEETTTYGKPVGFFGQEIMNSINLWVTSFKLINAAGQTDYWGGLTGDETDVQDYIFIDFGKKDEYMIAAAIKLTGAVESASLQAKRAAISSSSIKMSKMKQVTTVPFKGALK